MALNDPERTVDLQSSIRIMRLKLNSAVKIQSKSVMGSLSLILACVVTTYTPLLAMSWHLLS